MGDVQWIERVLDSIRLLVTLDASPPVVVQRVSRALRDRAIDPATPCERLPMISALLADRLEQERRGMLDCGAVCALGASHVLLARAQAFEAARDAARLAFSAMAVPA